jgi:hypothetical protein
VTGEPTPTGVQIADGLGSRELNNVPVGGVHEMVTLFPDWATVMTGGWDATMAVLLV